MKLAEVEHRAKSNTRRIDKLEQSTHALNRLATSVEVMATRQESMSGTLERLDEKVETLERKPGKRWEGIVDKMLVAAAAALVGFFLAQMGLG